VHFVVVLYNQNTQVKQNYVVNVTWNRLHKYVGIAVIFCRVILFNVIMNPRQWEGLGPLGLLHIG